MSVSLPPDTLVDIQQLAFSMLQNQHVTVHLGLVFCIMLLTYVVDLGNSSALALWVKYMPAVEALVRFREDHKLNGYLRCCDDVHISQDL